MGEMPWFYAMLSIRKPRYLQILSSNPPKDLLFIKKKEKGKILFDYIFPLAC